MNDLRRRNLEIIDSHLLNSRLNQIDQDYLEFEVKMASDLDIERIAFSLLGNEKFSTNPYNSILLYITGLTNEFDFKKASL
jgi:hypothetical protein